MNLLKKKQKSTEQEVVKDDLKERFLKEQENVIIKPETRKVTLKYRSVCGCGSTEIVEIEREVPFDSDLESGDFIDFLEKNDKSV